MRRMLLSIFLVVAIFSFAQPSSAQGSLLKNAVKGSAARGVTTATNVSKLTGINTATITSGVRLSHQSSVSGISVSRLSPTLSQNLLYDHKSLLQPLRTVKLKAKNHGVNKGMNKGVNKGVPAKTNKGVAGGKRSNSAGVDIPDMPSDSLHNSGGKLHKVAQVLLPAKYDPLFKDHDVVEVQYDGKTIYIDPSLDDILD